MTTSAQLARLQKRFDAIPKAVRDALKPALAACGQELVNAMKALAEPSRETGDLITRLRSPLAAIQHRRILSRADRAWCRNMLLPSRLAMPRRATFILWSTARRKWRLSRSFGPRIAS